MTVRILTAVGHQWEADLVTRLEATRELTVARRCADLADLLAAGAAGMGDLAVVSADLRGLDRDAIRHLAGHRVRTVGIVSSNGLGDGAPAEDAERRLRQLGLTTVLSAEMSPDELESSVLDVQVPQSGWGGGPGWRSESERPPDADHLRIQADEASAGTVIAVWGPTGAPGRTTIAVNLAAELAAAGRRVVLVDADTYGASVAQSLALLDEASGVASASRAAELGTLDLAGLARLAPEVSPRLRVLTGIPAARRWPEVRPGALEHILQLCRLLVDHVVVDCGFGIEDDEELSYDTQAPRRNASTLTVLAEADEVVVVGAADPVGLQRLVRAVQDLQVVVALPPRVLVNQVRPGAVGSSPRERIASALERFAGLDEPTFVPYDRDTLDAAMLHGRTLVEHAPGSQVRAAVADLARSYLPAPEPTRATRRGRRLGRPGRRERSRSATMSPWQTG